MTKRVLPHTISPYVILGDTHGNPGQNKAVRKQNFSTTLFCPCEKRGILLPDSAKEKPKEGTVLATGPGHLDERGVLQAPEVKVGDRVLFTAYAGIEVKSDEEGAEYLLMSEQDILGILK